MIGTVLRGVRAAADLAAQRVRGDFDEDAWGFDEQFARGVDPAFDLLFDVWWRVKVTGVDHVPAEGGALVVANHAGTLPWDAAMIATALRRRTAVPRRPRFLVVDRAFELPWVSVMARKLGGAPASPDNALRLLREGHVVLAFPEGAKGAQKAWSERYRLERFGRGEFVELALRAGVPIIPTAVVGSEEIYPRVGELPAIGRLLGAAPLPVTPTFPLLGPLGAVPLPSRWRIEFGDPVALAGRYGPADADDRALVLEVADAIRDIVQAKVHENLIRREGSFV
ncbi:lysophospholipid acyltransferase family protein [Conexibacter sp. SYSU D00693]|uniref:lysophospholipid acyltransferase family protein n=1 Tax=Conexibacter sp. SYSU D00693 TaxID=2812560 RepID=UPI00196AAA32|nr:lysophospholipid acyltransferase family protein [Conexibacter sp. SYSU D00693]